MNIQSIKTIMNKYYKNYSEVEKNAWLLLAVNFINSILISLCYFLPLFFVNELHLSILTAGTIMSAYSLGTIVGGILGGKLSDKLSPYLICITSLAIQGLALACFPELHLLNNLIIDLFILGVATYAFITSNYLCALSISQNNEKAKLKIINLMEVASNLGLGIAALIISHLSITMLKDLFITAGLVLFIISVGLMKNSQMRQLLSEKHDDIKRKNNLTLDFNKEIKNNLIIFVLINLFFVGIIISQLGSTYSLYLNKLFPHYNFGGFGIIFSLNTFLIVLLQGPISNSTQRLNKIFVVGIGAFLLGAGMFMLIFCFSFYLVLLACVIYTLGEILFFSVAQLICFENAPENKKGYTLGIYRMVYASSRVIGPAFGSYIYQTYNCLLLWKTCGIIGFACLLSSTFFKKLNVIYG